MKKIFFILCLGFFLISVANAETQNLIFSQESTSYFAFSGWCSGNEIQMFSGSECYDVKLDSGNRLSDIYNISISVSQSWNPTSNLVICEILPEDFGNCGAGTFNCFSIGNPIQQTTNLYELGSALNSRVNSGENLYIRFRTTAGGIALCTLSTSKPSYITGYYPPPPPTTLEKITLVAVIGIVCSFILFVNNIFIKNDLLNKSMIAIIFIVLILLLFSMI